MSDDTKTHDPEHAHDHRSAVRTYVVVYVSLLLLTTLTIGTSFIHLGHLHTVVALLIASIKAALVLVVFMHLTAGGPRTWLVVGASLFWLAILIGLTLNDYLTRPALFY